MDKKLCLSNDKVLAGVCGGIAEYYDRSKMQVRLLAVLLLFFFHGFTVLAYLILYIMLPKKQILP